MMAAMPTDPAPSAAAGPETLLHAAVAHHQTGALDEAGRLYRRVLELAPADADALHLLGLIARDGDALAGLGWMLRSLQVAPGLEPARANVRRLLEGLLAADPAGQGELVERLRRRPATRRLVVEVLEAVAARRPDVLPVWQWLSRFHYLDRDYEASARAVTQWLRLEPGNEWAQFMLNLFLPNARHRPPEAFRADLEQWRAYRPAGARRAIVTSCDARYFGLAKGLLLSLERLGLRRDYAVCFVDAGCTPAQRAWLADHVDAIERPTKEIDFPAGYPDYVRTHIARSFLPEIFPGHDAYLWLDSDMWVQQHEAVDLYFHEAARGRIAATGDVDRAYYNRYWHEQAFVQEIEEAYRLGFSDAHAARYRGKVCFNSGSFCAAADDPFWRTYEDGILRALHRAARQKDRFSHIIENAAFNDTLYTLGRIAILPSSCNWQCGLATPFRDTDGVVRQPMAPYDAIGIIHLTVQAMRADYLRLGLLYEGGAYLQPDEAQGFH